jgi:hypothetical protein
MDIRVICIFPLTALKAGSDHEYGLHCGFNGGMRLGIFLEPSNPRWAVEKWTILM